ncbi:MAG: hypothetical protein HRU04_18450 [Oceanospirillaceae bacterium]|nr:hypothetical protein [Oceanospirillaceae bacterium]
MVEVTAEGIPVLPAHDGSIVATKCGFWLKERVEPAYRELMGFDVVYNWESMLDMDEYLDEEKEGY